MGKCKCVNCDCNIIHGDLVESVRASLESDDVLLEMADFFRAVADVTRMKILAGLQERELCVCDISSLLNMTKSAVSHQLQNLKELNLVRSEKRGKQVWYSLADEHVREVFAITKEHVLEKMEEV